MPGTWAVTGRCLTSGRAPGGSARRAGQLDERQEEVVDLPDHADEFVEIDGLTDIGVGVQRVTAQDVLFRLRGRQDDDGYGQQRGVRLQFGEYLEPIAPREVQVEQDQSWSRHIGVLAGLAQEV